MGKEAKTVPVELGPEKNSTAPSRRPAAFGLKPAMTWQTESVWYTPVVQSLPAESVKSRFGEPLVVTAMLPTLVPVAMLNWRVAPTPAGLMGCEPMLMLPRASSTAFSLSRSDTNTLPLRSTATPHGPTKPLPSVLTLLSVATISLTAELP